MESASLARKLWPVSDYWRPRAVAQANGFHVKIVIAHGEHAWHTTRVRTKTQRLKRRTGFKMRAGDVRLPDGELFVFPTSVEHCLASTKETSLPPLAGIGSAYNGAVHT